MAGGIGHYDKFECILYVPEQRLLSVMPPGHEWGIAEKRDPAFEIHKTKHIDNTESDVTDTIKTSWGDVVIIIPQGL
jgi:hypothetical protein